MAVCIRERESTKKKTEWLRECVCVREREKDSKRKRVKVCVCVRERVRERKSQKREILSEAENVWLCEKARGR